MDKEHYRRPEDCIGDMLRAVYGEVYQHHRIDLGTKPEDYSSQPLQSSLSSIYSALENHRGFKDFVKRQYVIVDFFIPDPGFIVECDESQHFTLPRKISLERYPDEKKVGYMKEQWITRCGELNRHDNDPPSRDEARAWYDTLRDFLPEIKGFLPTVRLYAREREWCRMDPEKPEDVEQFGRIFFNRESESYVKEGKLCLPEQKSENPTLDLMIRYEYLANWIKLQYLLDCITGTFNHDSQYLTELRKNTQILNSGGQSFKAYFNQYIRNRGYSGPLFSDRDPNTYESVKELGEANDDLKRSVTGSDDWFMLFCEFTLVKTSLHELTADIHDPYNIDQYGYRDLHWLREFNEEPAGAKLRDFVVHCLNIGIDPSETHEGKEQEIEHLASCKYAEFQSRRKEWIEAAWYNINRIKSQMNTRYLSGVMQWNKYALCAYDTGPVFIRKNREFILPKIAHSFENFDRWDQTRLRDNLNEIIGQHVIFVIEDYWDHFQGEQIVEFFDRNPDLADEIIEGVDVLNSFYRNIASHLELTEIPGTMNSGKSRMVFLQPKVLHQETSRVPSVRHSEKKSGPPGEFWTESGFLAHLREKSGSEKKVEIARKLIEWARSQGLNLGEKWRIQSFIPYIEDSGGSRQLFRIKVNGKLGLEFRFIDKYPQFASTKKRQRLIDSLNTINGFDFTLSAIKDPKMPFYDLEELLADAQNFDAFITMSTRFFDELRRENQ